MASGVDETKNETMSARRIIVTIDANKMTCGRCAHYDTLVEKCELCSEWATKAKRCDRYLSAEKAYKEATRGKA